MRRGRGGRDDFFGFGDPFAGFGGFGRPGSLISSFFGGRDPFDDPFFTRPFGSLMGPSMFGPSVSDDGRSFFGETSNAGSQHRRRRGLAGNWDARGQRWEGRRGGILKDEEEEREVEGGGEVVGEGGEGGDGGHG